MTKDLVMKGTYNAPAPGELETVRELLNTWRIPSATRQPEDQLPALMADPEAWATRFPSLPPCDRACRSTLGALRDDLRALSARQPAALDMLNQWLARYPAQAHVIDHGEDLTVAHQPAPASGVIGEVLAMVVSAMASDTWLRLKVCPDCQWAFYDHSRSKTKIWCDMLSGDAGGRSCGTIAKVRRYKERHADEAAG